jgi:hypothetical protein
MAVVEQLTVEAVGRAAGSGVAFFSTPSPGLRADRDNL